MGVVIVACVLPFILLIAAMGLLFSALEGYDRYERRFVTPKHKQHAIGALVSFLIAMLWVYAMIAST